MADIYSLLNKGKVTKPEKQKLEMVSPRPQVLSSITKSVRSWKVDGTYLIHNIPKNFNIDKYKHDNKVKVAAFDLDGTLANTKSGLPFPTGPNDWVWWSDRVVDKIKHYADEKYLLVIFTNQGGVITRPPTSKSYAKFTGRVDRILGAIGIQDVLVFAAAKKPMAKNVVTSTDEEHSLVRKPNIGMWKKLEDVIKVDIDKTSSFFVGDAAGRPNDFLDSDLKFATAVDIKFYTPEDVF